MVSKKERNNMRDYLVSKLEKSHKSVIPYAGEIVSGIRSRYITVDDNSAIVLVDQVYPCESLREVNKRLGCNMPNIISVLYKDGETFFRNASKKNYFKKSKLLSLKNYTNDEMRRMILFRPEEQYLNSKNGKLQYYQPDSERLEEGIDEFKFGSVMFDYSHLESDEFKPQNRESERLHIWKNRNHFTGDFKLGKGLLHNIS